MELRDQLAKEYAIEVIRSLLASHTPIKSHLHDYLSRDAYDFADKMLEARRTR